MVEYHERASFVIIVAAVVISHHIQLYLDYIVIPNVYLSNFLLSMMFCRMLMKQL